MSKAILVMNMPRSCLECHLSTDEGFRCIFLVDKAECSIEKRLDNCPLRDLPEKAYNGSTFETSQAYTRGYNACIDDILRGSEENEQFNQPPSSNRYYT